MSSILYGRARHICSEVDSGERGVDEDYSHGGYAPGKHSGGTEAPGGESKGRRREDFRESLDRQQCGGRFAHPR
jgi:hypothetical protein